MTTPPPSLLHALGSIRNRVRNEALLQADAEKALRGAGIAFESQVVLAPDSRIDLKVGGWGIELKVDGSFQALLYQCGRYLGDASIEGLIVVGPSKLLRGLPQNLSKKPLVQVPLAAGTFA